MADDVRDAVDAEWRKAPSWRKHRFQFGKLKCRTSL